MYKQEWKNRTSGEIQFNCFFKFVSNKQNRKMRVESVNNEIKLTFSKNALNITEIQSFIDYIKFREISALSKATQEDANKLAEEINQSWWDKNKHKFE